MSWGVEQRVEAYCFMLLIVVMMYQIQLTCILDVMWLDPVRIIVVELLLEGRSGRFSLNYVLFLLIVRCSGYATVYVGKQRAGRTYCLHPQGKSVPMNLHSRKRLPVLCSDADSSHRPKEKLDAARPVVSST
jgi:hypothetical protein